MVGLSSASELGTSNFVSPTEEQSVIIQAVGSGRNILISALAGTGKTSTLKMIANSYPKRRGLYLAYNASLKKEAQGKFPRHIDCKTIHGLAYEKQGKKFGKQITDKLHNSTIVEYLRVSGIKYGKFFASPSLIASGALDMVRTFCYSISEEIQPQHYSRQSVEKLLTKYENQDLDFDLDNILTPKTFLETVISHSYAHAKILWKAMSDIENKLIPASHDTYLKLFQLSKPTIEGYDYIMLDEAQDANPAILDILSNQKVQRIYVGDKNQQIYGFRGTTNAMESIQGENYYLTQSFRFGPAIADEANKVLEELKETKKIKGYDLKQSKIGPIDPDQKHAFIARTNAGIFDKIIEYGPLNKKIHYVGDIRKIISTFESAYYLKKGNLSLVKDTGLKRFSSWEKFAQEAEFSCDHEYKAMILFLDTYRDEALNTIKLIESSCLCPEEEADIIMSTAHKAKGREWKQVRLNNDFRQRKNLEENNIYYVAVTRASETLELPDHIVPTEQKLLTIELVPETCWFSNVRSNVRAVDWNRLQKYTFKAAGYRCEICMGVGKDWPVECHEIWHYDDEKKIQKLEGLIALCPACHQVKHMGLANLQGKGNETASHLIKVNNWPTEKGQAYIDEQFKIWERRSVHQWTLDISWLEKLGISVQQVDREQADGFESGFSEGIQSSYVKEESEEEKEDAKIRLQDPGNNIAKPLGPPNLITHTISTKSMNTLEKIFYKLGQLVKIVCNGWIKLQWIHTKKGTFYNPRLKTTVFLSDDGGWAFVYKKRYHNGFESPREAKEHAFYHYISRKNLKIISPITEDRNG